MLKSIIQCTAMINSYAKDGKYQEAFSCFIEMRRRGIRPNHYTFSCILKSCRSLPLVEAVHGQIIRTPLPSNSYTLNSLICKYCEFSSFGHARQVFDDFPHRDVVSWTSMISGLSQKGRYTDTFNLFREMQQEDCVKYSERTLTCVLSACAEVGDAVKGRQIHVQIIKEGLFCDVFLLNALVDIYAKTGNMQDASRVFDKMCERNTVSWASMVAGYVHNGMILEAMRFFVGIPDKDVFSWTAMISGFVQNGFHGKALALFYEMKMGGSRPNSRTMATILPAYGAVAVLVYGRKIHAEAIKRGFQEDVFVGSGLIDMYAKCGSLDDAFYVFAEKTSANSSMDSLHCNEVLRTRQRDIVLWTAMITSYGKHGFGREAVSLFEQLQNEGIKPDHVAFLGILSACANSRMVDEGWHFFKSMKSDYGLRPIIEHYFCMVDLLGRAGSLKEAKALIDSMPMQPNSSLWFCLLGACKMHADTDLARDIERKIIELGHSNLPTNSCGEMLICQTN